MNNNEKNIEIINRKGPSDAVIIEALHCVKEIILRIIDNKQLSAK